MPPYFWRRVLSLNLLCACAVVDVVVGFKGHISSLMAFSEGEKVLYFEGPLLYEAEVLKTEMKDGTQQVQVTSESDGKWLPESKVLKYNETNLQKQKELLTQHSNEKKPVKRERPYNTDSPGPTKQQKTFSKILYCRVAKSSSSETVTTHEQDSNCPSSDKNSTEQTSSPISTSKLEQSPQKSQNEPLTEIRGVIFDMDGTLTLPVLDFKGIRESLGLAPGVDILPTVQKYSPEERAKAMAIIEEYEDDGLKKLQLQPGVLDLLHYLAEREIQRAVMTRNSTRATKVFMERLKESLSASQSLYPCLQSDAIFSQVITRDFEPCKPHPAPVHHICDEWGLQPNQVAVVGDDKTDMISGLRAGTAVNILLRNDRNKVQVDYSSFAVDTLTDICSLFDSPMTVSPKEPPTH